MITVIVSILVIGLAVSIIVNAIAQYDLSTWEKFGVDKYWKLEYTDRKNVDQELNSNKDRAIWFAKRLYGTQPV
jgi:hypothetical protein